MGGTGDQISGSTMNAHAKAPGQRTLKRACGTGEPTLDPSDWAAFERTAHAALDDALALLRDVDSQPVWRPVPDWVKAELTTDLPREAKSPEEVCADVARLMLPYVTGNIHPRFFGWVHGSGTAGGVIAEMLTAAINANVGGRDHGAVYVERQVISWCREIFGFPAMASGLLVSGTSMATLIALNVARNEAVGRDVRRTGLVAHPNQLTAYSSAQGHSSVAKALDMLGIGTDALRPVAVNKNLQMDVDALARAIEADRTAGRHPFCVVATAGTVNTGAMDPLDAIADICAEQNVWLHVDGAFGAMAMLSAELRHLVAGVERAHSLAFDFHKWLHVPYDAGCVLVRDGAAHKAAFSARPDYLAGAEMGLAGGNPWFCEFGPELSRGNRALKVWFTFMEHGTKRLGDQVLKNCRQAQYLAKRVHEARWLELLAPVSLNIVCLRFCSPHLSDAELDAANAAIVQQLQIDGIAAPSTTRIDGRLAIRVNITNHRTRTADLDLLVDSIVELGTDQMISGALRPSAPAVKAETPSRGIETRDLHAMHSAGGGRKSCDYFRHRLNECLGRPELRFLAQGVDIGIAHDLSLPFLVTDGKSIGLSPDCLNNPLGAAVLLRHALELTLLQRKGSDIAHDAWPIASALLACRTAGTYLNSLADSDHQKAIQSLPGWLSEAYEGLRQSGAGSAPHSVPPNFDKALVCLLALQGVSADTARGHVANLMTTSQACQIFAGIGDLSLPTETLFVMGGDSRIAINPITGSNGYGSSPRPALDEVSFSSSTATSVSQPQFDDGEALRQTLLASAIEGSLESRFAEKMADVRAELLELTGAAQVPGTEVVLSASGTDAVLPAVCCARPCPDERLTSIVIAPNENGSGSALAAGACYFNSQTASGATATVGDPIGGFATHLIEVKTVRTRNSDGIARDRWEVDGTVELMVEQAIGAGRRCLLHVLDTSKLGWGAPSLDLVDRLKARHGDNLEVVIDACQMRLGPGAVAAYLNRGYMVQITGSKFFCGPPFCGALLLPCGIAERIRDRKSIPDGLKHFCDRDEWPETLHGPRAAMAARRNYGVLTRWTAALSEMRRFHEVPTEDAKTILARFARATTQLIQSRGDLTLVEAQPFNRSPLGLAPAETVWSEIPTIFAFMVNRQGPDGSGQPLSVEEAKQVHTWLNRDVSACLPTHAGDSERQLAARRFHIGQPVKLGERSGSPFAALRICSSARIVASIYGAHDLAALGRDPLTETIADVRACLEKISLLLRHFDDLRSSGA